MKKALNTAQRVEILLKEGVEKPETWAKVHGYEEPTPSRSDDWEGWAGEWQRLRDHHLTETKFLFDVIREMREQILSQQESIESLENHNGKIVTD